MATVAISEPTLRRLPMYYQYLIKQRRLGRENISCTYIASSLDLVPVQVRKDLQSAGAVGKPKIGYEITGLIAIIEHTLGYDNSSEAFLVGAGNLGQALLGYKEFEKLGMDIIAAFDSSTLKIGKNYFGKKVFPLNKFKNLSERMNVKIGVITTPATQAQDVADLMVKSGIKGIWNFASVHLVVPEDVHVQNENLASSLSVLLRKVNN